MTVRDWVEASAQAIEMLAVAVIVVVIALATAHYVLASVRRRGTPAAYEEYRHRVGRALLLTLEILVAADIVRTVALDNTLRSIAGLGLLVLIRTFLSWSLMLEIEGRWPWQRGGAVHVALHGVADDRPPSGDRTAERAA
jgi:uncharacterized membrane protein